MLAKSRRGAFVMAAIAHATALSASATWVGATRFLRISAAAETTGAANTTVFGWLALLALIASSVGVISIPIYRLDDSHFGVQGAIRWAMAGALYGLLWRASSLLISSEILKLVLQPFLISLAYSALFKLFPHRVETKTPQQPSARAKRN
jgi:hypothetical protein